MISESIKLVAVVITYYPDLDEVKQNIKQYIVFVDKIIIWDNTPIAQRVKQKINLPEFEEKIIYLGTEKNEGIAFAINRGIEWAIKNKYSHILTMDQDSCWDNFTFYKNHIIKFMTDQSIGIFSPVIYEQHKREFAEITFVKDAITSGSVYSIEMATKIGGVREDYFIDAVDLEYCYWAKRNGYNTVVIGNAFLKQKFGNQTARYFLNKTYYPANYSATRIFYIIRNHIFLWKEYPELSDFEKKRIVNVYIRGRIKEVILFENNKLKKLYMICKSILHGFFGIGLIRRQVK